MSRELPLNRKHIVVGGLLFAVLVLGMALRLYRLDAKTLWTDEIKTFATSQLDFMSILRLQVETAGHPPVVYVVTHFFLSGLGENDFVVRLPAALFGSLSILLAYKVGQTLWGQKEGLAGAFLLAVNAYHVQYSQDARQYALMVFLALLSLLFLLKAVRSNRTSLWLAFSLCTSLSLYNHYFAFLFLPAEVIVGGWVIAEDWMSRRRGGAWALQLSGSDGTSSPAAKGLMLCLSLLLVGVSYLPWIPVLQAQFPKNVQSGVVGATTRGGFELVLIFLRDVLAAFGGGESAAALVCAGLFALGLASCRWKQIALVGMWMGAPFAFLLAVAPTHFIHPRYVLFTLPLYLLVVAKGVTLVASLLERRLRGARGHRGFLVMAGSSLAVVAAFNVAPLTSHYAAKRPDWRAAAQYIAADVLPGGFILADGDGYGGVKDGMRVVTRLPFYLTRCGIPTVPILPVDRRLGQAIVDCAGGCSGEAWAVVLHREGELGGGRAQDQISRVDFDQVSVIRLLEPSGDPLRDTVSMLHVLRDLLPTPEARFDVHLALAEIYLRTGRVEQALSELDMAGQVMPARSQASRDLSDLRSELEELSGDGDVEAQYALRRALGLEVALLGYDLYPSILCPGEAVHLTLYWRSHDTMDTAYTVFTHLLDGGGRIWAQQDNQPQSGERPTSTWLPGEIVRDEYDLLVNPDAPAGEYVLEVGMYDWDSGERLPVWDDEGERLEYDRILLRPVTVRE